MTVPSLVPLWPCLPLSMNSGSPSTNLLSSLSSRQTLSRSIRCVVVVFASSMVDELTSRKAGAFFGSLFAYPSAYFLGRKPSLIIFSLVFMLGAGMMLGANGDRGLGLILAGRVLAGIGVGAASMVTPIYISEISPPAVRGRIVGIYELGWQIGGLVGFWINYGLAETMAPSHRQWIIPFAVQVRT